MTFEYSAEELGLDKKISPKFLDIRRLRPLDKNQPWGIFFIAFDETKLPVVALRRLLSKLALTKRSSSNTGEHASWNSNDLLLISQTGTNNGKSISFAHFASNPEKKDLPILKVLGWDSDNTGLKIDHVTRMLREKLIWPNDPADSEAWREQWRDAFKLKNREVIQSSKIMAERLGQLALKIRTRLRELLFIESEDGPIHKLMSSFQKNLISDLNSESFSDMYAQTIAYGLLSARIINPKENTADAAHTQIPITNPFLRDLMETFVNIGGRNNDKGLSLDFDELGISEVVDLLDNTNMEAVLIDFGDRNQKEDPVMHFFEGFLEEYDRKIKKDRGVFYTPQSVVSFIVRSVDHQLRTEFGLEDGLADTTSWGELAKRIKNLKVPEGVPHDQSFVQILDPATGTGTFPVEVVDLIYKTMTAKWQLQGNREAQIINLWNDYVPKHLLPRLHGYELMMAPYAIAHMKIGLKLYETGYKFNKDERARIYLTNALEPYQDSSGSFDFAIPALARESEAVNSIRFTSSFTVVIGNPPYLGEGGVSKGWIGDLITDYKKEPGGIETLKEKTSKWLNDLYVKFVRLSSHFIEKNHVGVIGLITNNGYLNNPTFRGMRWHIQNTFNKILILDLHGNSKKKERTPEGNLDENVFDIQQGVSIIIGSKKSLFIKAPAKLMHKDLWGDRQFKYSQLVEPNLSNIIWEDFVSKPPFYLFQPFDHLAAKEFNNWMSLIQIFPLYGTGIITARDNFVIDFSAKPLLRKIKKYINKNIADEEIIQEFGLKENDSWKVPDSRQQLIETLMKKGNELDLIYPILYRPFDQRKIIYHQSVIHRPKIKLMEHIIDQDNVSICSTRSVEINQGFSHIFASRYITQHHTVSNKEVNYQFSLYRYQEDDLFFNSTSQSKKKRVVNLSNEFLDNISTSSKLKYKEICTDPVNEFSPEDVLGYIYAVLHSPKYRTQFDPSLRIDFPRIPSNPSKDIFLALASHGRELISLHLNEFAIDNSDEDETCLLINCEIEDVVYTNETIYIDKAQTIGFSGVKDEVWHFKIGGYQVCQKWLKDRQSKRGKNSCQGQILTNEDIQHFQKIVKAISETIKIMAKIDKVIEKYGGWPNAFTD